MGDGLSRSYKNMDVVTQLEVGILMTVSDKATRKRVVHLRQSSLTLRVDGDSDSGL